MLGGVALRTREAMLICEAAGFDVILVETVGVGQSETAVAGMVDCFVVLALPGAGDDLQGIKKGVVELADIIAVNKSDGETRSRALRAAADLRAALDIVVDGEAGWRTPVLTVSAIENDGLDRLWAAIERAPQREQSTAARSPNADASNSTAGSMNCCASGCGNGRCGSRRRRRCWRTPALPSPPAGWLFRGRSRTLSRRCLVSAEERPARMSGPGASSSPDSARSRAARAMSVRDIAAAVADRLRSEGGLAVTDSDLAGRLVPRAVAVPPTGGSPSAASDAALRRLPAGPPHHHRIDRPQQPRVPLPTTPARCRPGAS